MGGCIGYKTAHLQRETRTLIIQDNNMLVRLCEIPYILFCASPILFQASLVTYFEINQSVIQLLVLINGLKQVLSQQIGQ